MKRIDIINLYRVLSEIRIAGMTDSGVKGALISAHLRLFKYAKENDDFAAGLIERFKPEEKDSADEAYNKWLNEDVDVTLDKISRDAFVSELAKTQTDIFIGALQYLEPLFEN